MINVAGCSRGHLFRKTPTSWLYASDFQHPGVVSSISGSPSLRASNPGRICANEARQYNSRGLHTETETHSISLLREVMPNLEWAQVNLQQLSAVYGPSQKNIQVEYLPRIALNNNEWSLLLQVFLGPNSLVFSSGGGPFVSPF